METETATKSASSKRLFREGQSVLCCWFHQQLMMGKPSSSVWIEEKSSPDRTWGQPWEKYVWSDEDNRVTVTVWDKTSDPVYRGTKYYPISLHILGSLDGKKMVDLASSLAEETGLLVNLVQNPADWERVDLNEYIAQKPNRYYSNWNSHYFLSQQEGK